MDVTAEDYYQLVRVAGTVTSGYRLGVGKQQCYDLTHGAEGSEKVDDASARPSFIEG